MHIAVIGTEALGLVVSAGFADFGNDVVCVGRDQAAIEPLQSGNVDVYEAGLDALLESGLKAGRMHFATDLEAAVKNAEVVFLTAPITVGADGEPKLDQLFEVSDRIAKSIEGQTVVVIKSTAPVGTVDRLKARMGVHTSEPFAVVCNPSFLKGGNMVHDFMQPDRVLIGTDDERAEEVLRRLYAPFVRTRDRIFVVGARSAELAKFATSALLASRISFMNDLALLCDDLGADIEAVRRVLGADPRIGTKWLFAGPGFGGRQFQNDLSILLHTARDTGRDLSIVKATEAINRRQKRVMLERIHAVLGEDLADMRVAVWGLSFKPKTDEIGGSPAMRLVEQLLEASAEVVVHDPRAMDNAREALGERVRYADSMYEAVDDVDALALVTEWHSYRRPDFVRIKAAMRGTLLVDGRNIWDPDELRELGFRYLGIGRS
jgi:UDPglucose 6-dehydrogenase